MSAARTKRHNNIDKDGERRAAYREFGVHLSLTTVTEKAVRCYSRSLRHLPLEQLEHWRRSSTNWRQLSASGPACTAAPLDKSPASSVGRRKCSRVVNGSCVFTGCAVGLLNAQFSPLIDLFLISKRYVKYLWRTFCTKTRWHKGRWSVRWDEKKVFQWCGQ